MKKLLVILLSLALLAGAGFFALWELRLAPEAPFNPTRPQLLMEELLTERSSEDWREALLPYWTEAVTEYESRPEIFKKLFESAVSEGLSFRSAAESGSFLLCSGERDIAKLRFGCENGVWRQIDTELLLTGECHSILITVPENVVPTVNGRALSENELINAALPYEDMSETEAQFAACPLRHVYAVSGLYEWPTVEAEGARLLLRQEGRWSYEPTDARSYRMSIVAPAEAKVSVGGVTLGDGSVSGSESVRVDVNIPEELLSALPVYKRYELCGLYADSYPVIVTDGDGRVLELSSEEGGVLSYLRTAETAPSEEVEKLAKDYFWALCNYGAGKVYFDTVSLYVQPECELWNTLEKAWGSLFWIQGMKLELGEICADSYLSIGDDCCVCTVSATGVVGNYYMSYEAEFVCQLLMERTEYGWKVTDMAYE